MITRPAASERAATSVEALDSCVRCCRLPGIAVVGRGGPPRLTELDLFSVDADRPDVRIDGFGLLAVLNGCRIMS